MINTGKSLFTKPCRKKKNHENQNKNTHYRVHSCSVNRDFPVLVTIFLCFNYRVFPALITAFFCFDYILSLFYYHFFPVQFTGFSLFYKNSDLQGIPCIGYNSFMFQLQGFTCFNNTFSLFWLHYFPVFLTFFSLFDLQVFP